MTAAAMTLQTLKDVDNYTLAGGYDIASRVLKASMTDEEFLQWTRCEGPRAGLWWLFGAPQASRPDWFLRADLADGSGSLVLQGQSKRVQLSSRNQLTGELLHFPCLRALAWGSAMQEQSMHASV